jgi:hypothetical protein
MGPWARLTQPISLCDRYLEPIPNRVDNILGQWCSGRHEALDRGKIIVVDNWMFAETEQNWRNDICVRDFVGLNSLTPSVEGEFGQDNSREAGVDRVMDEARKSYLFMSDEPFSLVGNQG